MRRPDNVKVGDRFVVNSLAKSNNATPGYGSTLNAGDVVTCGGEFTHPSQEGLVVELLWSELEGPYKEPSFRVGVPDAPFSDRVMLELIKASPETALLLIKELSA